jgi:hypothetical protein
VIVATTEQARGSDVRNIPLNVATLISWTRKIVGALVRGALEECLEAVEFGSPNG